MRPNRRARNVLLAAGLYCAHGVLFCAMTVYTLAYTTSAQGPTPRRHR